ncbi:efflux RND transporter permease subunit [Cesiribacter andamanensis]|uniref:Putative membrane protein ydgH n=1 Tax=Cesiribacter andamanensis AMV16 TaxID=1279009 RepID=M7NQG4_9BACT|nr:MMPL family transporter [Cesiribacter andamanensis]EMR00744.1 Putative membrane protein ydgH [Cesiribacter andamanensis AMV16]
MQTLAKRTLYLIGLITLVLAFFIGRLGFDYNFENFFPTQDKDLDFFLSYREAFENDNDFLLIGIQNREGIFQQEFLQRLDTVTRQLDSLSLTRQVLSITNLKNPIIGPLGVLQPPALRINEPGYYAADSASLYANPAVRGTLVAQNTPAVAILVNHQLQISKRKADSLMQQVAQILAPHPFDAVHLAGKVRAQSVYVEKMQVELALFAAASVVLVVIFLTLAYRSAWGVAVPILVVILTVVWVLGIMGATGKKLDVMMVLLPTIMFVVGMSDVVHILTKYIEELRNGLPKQQALRLTLKEIGLATFLTSLTTAIGFLTLLTANILPIRDFGLYVAIGVFAAFVLAFTVMPAVLALMKTPKVVHRSQNRLLWVGSLRRLFLWVVRRRYAVLVFYGGILILSGWGISRLQSNTFLLEDIGENDPLKQDVYFFDEHFGGNKPFEMAILVQDSSRSVWDPEVLAEIQKMETYLQQQYGVGTLASPLLLVKGVNRALNGGDVEQFRLPESPQAYRRIESYLRRLEGTQAAVPLSAQKGQLGRMSGRMPDWGSQLSREKNAALDSFMLHAIRRDLVSFQLTGTSVLVDRNAEYITRNMLEGLGIAFGVIALIIGLLYRSWRMTLIALVPNIIPLLMIAGIMGWAGIYLKASTSIIFTIAFGIAVDDTIHFLSKLKLELNKGRSLLYAIKHTYLFTGKAIIITSTILAGGFLTLLLSSFGSTFYTGLLVSLTLIFAVIADLSLLPVLLLLFLPKKNSGKDAA